MSHYRVEVASYARPFRQPLQTSHGIWAVREGAIVTLTAADGSIGQGEIAPLEWFGTERLDEAIAFCAALQGEITTAQIFGIPDRFPCCQFGFESAIEGLSACGNVGDPPFDKLTAPPKSPLKRGTLNSSHVPPFLRATVYTQVIESGKLPAEPPPNPQFWGDRKIQSPPELGDLGGRRDQNDSQVNLCVHGSFLRGARGDQDSKRSPSIATLLPTGKQAIDSWQPHHDHGHRTFKWKIGVNPIDDEIQWFHALHQQLPRDCQLRLDANAGLSLDAAKRWLEAFEQYPIEYLEQPLPIEQFAAMQTLGETYGTPIALDESIANLQSLKDCHDRGWEGIYVIKPAIVGSPRKLRDFLQCHTLDVVFSSVFETEVGYAAGLRLAEQLGCNRALGYGTNHWWV